VSDLGAYCSFVDENGQPISWLQRVDSIAVNGVHAVVVAPGLVRLQMVRVRHTYDLLITKHVLAAVDGAQRPALQSLVVFYGRRGTLEMDLCGKDSSFCGTVRPFFSAAAENQRPFQQRLRMPSRTLLPRPVVLDAVTHICFSRARLRIGALPLWKQGKSWPEQRCHDQAA